MLRILALTSLLGVAPIQAQTPQWPTGLSHGVSLGSGSDWDLRLHGRVFLDGVQLSGPGQQDAQEIRQARVSLRGALPRGLELLAMWDLAGNEVDFKTLELRAPVTEDLSLSLGHFREPLGLDAQTSTRQLALPERAAVTQALSPGRNAGLGLVGKLPTGGWSVGVFREADEVSTNLGETRSLTARTHWSQGAAQEHGLLHLALSGSYRDPRDGTLRFGAHPGSAFAERLVDSGELAADQAGQLALEAAWAQGPWIVQGEGLFSEVDLTGGGEADLFGGYVQGSVLLTGERRPYRLHRGLFGDVKPMRPEGAWELSARAGWLDLDEADGGIQGDLALGINLHFSSRSRLMLSYQHSEERNSNLRAEMFLVRLHVGF